MKRWVLFGAAVLGALVFWMIRQLGASQDVTPTVHAASFAQVQLPPPPKFPVQLNERPEEEDELFQEKPEGPVVKLDPKSEEFFLRFDEMIAPRLTKEAADCYRGGKQRDQKIKFGFKKHVKDGRVRITDVKIMANTLGDAALERCMFEKVANFGSWKDDEFPDVSDIEDEVVIRIRALKKYQQEEDRASFPMTKLHEPE